MRRKARVGLMPLFLQLYDEVAPDMRNVQREFLNKVADGLRANGVEVIVSDICRLASESQQAVDHLESQNIDLVATLHLAYSPSLESVDALCATDLPILLIDTTPDFSFDQDTPKERIMYNHGIHGVQDLASVLLRRGRDFEIVAGHYVESDVLVRAANITRAAQAAQSFENMKVLRIGEAFRGMGDFAVEESVLRESFGITVEQIQPGQLTDAVESISDEEVAKECALDRERYEVVAAPEVHQRSAKVGLGLRKYLDQNGYGAFSQSFLAFDSKEGLVNTVPFLEASKAMARGLGYAGEGDVLTACLVGALSASFGKTTFSEVFCPDWKGNALFISHMGEVNPEVAAARPRLFEKPYKFSEAENPAVLACSPAPGPAVLVNLVPAANDQFHLILASVEVLEDTAQDDMRETIRGWIRPGCDVAEFLEIYSSLGGTHHSALVLGDRMEELSAFASFLGIESFSI